MTQVQVTVRAMAGVTAMSEHQQSIRLHSILHGIIDAYQKTLEQLSPERAQGVLMRRISDILAESAEIHVEGADLDEVIESVIKQFRAKLGVEVTISRVTSKLLEVECQCPFAAEIHPRLREGTKMCPFLLEAAAALKQQFPNARLLNSKLTDLGSKGHVAL
jgi:predicted ArsR family transcriptional regulator